MRLPAELSALAGPEWDGWRLGADRLLYAPEWRRGFTAPELRALFWRCQQVAALEADLRMMRAAVDAAEMRAEHAERLAWYLRRQLVLEARLGALVERLAG